MRKFLLLSFLFLLFGSVASADWTINKSEITDDDVFLFQDTTASAGQKTGYISGALLKDYVLSDVIDFSATSPLSFNSTTGVLSLTPWASQSALETWLGWAFSGSGGGITVSASLPTIAGSATLNDTTHVLTVASDTGYTQFTGSFTAWDTTPSAFGFGTITDAVAGQEYCWTTPVTVAGINRSTAVSSTADSYKINGTTSTATSIALGDTLIPCMVASNTAGATVSGNMTIGGVAGDPVFSVTTAADEYVSFFSDNFNRTDSATVEGSWTSEVDTLGKLSIASNKLHVSTVDSYTAGYVEKTFTEKLKYKVTAKLSIPNKTTGVMTPRILQAGSNTCWYVSLSTSGGNITGFSITTRNEDYTYNTAQSVPYSFVNGTEYTIDLYGQKASSGTALDGQLELRVNGVSVYTATNLDMFGAAGTFTGVRAGLISADNSTGSLEYDIDDFSVSSGD